MCVRVCVCVYVCLCAYVCVCGVCVMIMIMIMMMMMRRRWRRKKKKKSRNDVIRAATHGGILAQPGLCSSGDARAYIIINTTMLL